MLLPVLVGGCIAFVYSVSFPVNCGVISEIMNMIEKQVGSGLGCRRVCETLRAMAFPMKDYGVSTPSQFEEVPLRRPSQVHNGSFALELFPLFHRPTACPHVCGNTASEYGRFRPYLVWLVLVLF